LNSYKIINIILFLSFVFPFCTYILSLVIGISLPYLGDLLLITLISLYSLSKIEFFKIKKFDIVILFYFIFVLIFIFRNFIFLGALYRFSEIRYIIFIPLLYFFFRISILTKSTSQNVLDLIYLILKLNLFICIVEFILINFSPFSQEIINRSLTIFVNKDRVYDSIFGTLYKPAGLFHGSGNASIALSILFIWALKLKNSNLFFYLLIVFGLIITFTLTSFVVLILGTLFILYNRVKFFNLNIILFFLFILIYFSGQITNFRSSGITASELEEVSFESAMLVYQISFEKYTEQFSLTAHKFTSTEINNLTDLIGPTGEIYLLRVGIYYGNILFFILLFWLFFLVLKIFNNKNFTSKIAFFISLILIITSFHYPSINGIPLYILLPLTTVLGLNFDSKSII
jgi:hypothetical protein